MYDDDDQDSDCIQLTDMYFIENFAIIMKNFGRKQRMYHRSISCSKFHFWYLRFYIYKNHMCECMNLLYVFVMLFALFRCLPLPFIFEHDGAPNANLHILWMHIWFYFKNWTLLHNTMRNKIRRRRETHRYRLHLGINVWFFVRFPFEIKINFVSQRWRR